jgi:sulfate permease, SulP family
VTIPWPKSVTSLRGYTQHLFVSDLIAGITVGLVALPLAMAFAISSGLPPQNGLYCAVVTGFLISALGGSKYQIGGPTGAFVVVIYGIVQKYGVDGLHMCTLMAGVMLAILGLSGLGSAVKFIPRPVVIGFTNGIALLIASTQLKDFFGIRVDNVPGEFVARLKVLAANASQFSTQAAVLSVATLVLILLMRRFTPRIPGAIVALFGGTIAARALGLDLETIGTKFGGIPTGLPHFTNPHFRPDLLPVLISPALTIMMLGAIESLLSANVADRMARAKGGDRHDPNLELFGQGVANILSPLFGGLPATGAIARTATSIRSGAKTPVAGIVHALTILAVLIWAAPLAKHIPLSVLAAILMVVAYNMGEWGEIPDLLKLSKSDISIWLLTFALTVFADLTVAVEAGMILAALVYIRKVTSTTTVSQVTPEYLASGRAHILQDKQIPDYAVVFRIHGPFLFGATDKISDIAAKLDSLPPVVMLRLRNMTAIDATGLQALEDLADAVHTSGRALILCGAREQPARLMRDSEFEQHVGPENICPNITEALKRASQVHLEMNRDGRVRRDG